MVEKKSASESKPHQIFISYARKDDRTLSSDQKGWVHYFDLALAAELESRGLSVQLWRDTRDIDKNDFWDREIEQGLEKSGILVALVSPNYIRREYCLHELDGFIRSLESRGTERSGEYVYKVLIRPVPHEQHPPPLQGKEGFKFYSINREENKVNLYYVGYGKIIREDYWDVLYELSDSLEKRIRSVPNERSRLPRERKGTAYLAEATADRSDDYRRLRHELQTLAYEVVPSEPLPTLSGEASQVVEDAMAQASLSIHLLGATPGFTPEGSESPIVPFQLEQAANRVRRRDEFRRLIWLPQDLRPEDERQREVLHGLTSGKSLLVNDELVREPFQKFVEVVLDSLPHGRESSRVTPRVFILCQRDQEGAALDLQQTIFDAGCEPIVPLFVVGDEDRRAVEDEELSKCDGVVVIYGDERQERWVREQLDRLESWRALNRTRDFAAKVLCLVGAATPRKEKFVTRKASIARAFEDTTPEGIDDFLGRLAT